MGGSPVTRATAHDITGGNDSAKKRPQEGQASHWPQGWQIQNQKRPKGLRLAVDVRGCFTYVEQPLMSNRKVVIIKWN